MNKMRFYFCPQRLSGVLLLISERENKEAQTLDLLLKFRKQTIRRLQHLQDIERVSTDSSCVRSTYVAIFF